MAVQWSCTCSHSRRLSVLAYSVSAWSSRASAAEVRDQLLGELVGAVVVGAVGDRDGQPVGLGVGPHGVVGPRLRRVVGRAGPVGGVLVEDLVGIERQVPVDLAGRDVVEPPDVRLAGRLQHGLGPEHVGAEEQTGVEHRQGVVRLGGEMDDRVDPLAPQRLLGGGRVADVALDEDDPVLDVGQAGSVAGIGEDVVDDDMVLGVLFDPVSGEVRPDETGTSRHEKAHSAGNISPAPNPSPALVGPQMHHVAGADGPGRPAVSTTRRPASSMALARPAELLGGQVTRTSWPSVAQRARTSSARPRRRPPGPGGPHRGAQGVEQVLEEDPAVHRLRRPAQVVQAGAPGLRRARPGHVDPDADHGGGEGAPRRTPPRPGPRPAWPRPPAGRWAT